MTPQTADHRSTAQQSRQGHQASGRSTFDARTSSLRRDGGRAVRCEDAGQPAGRDRARRRLLQMADQRRRLLAAEPPSPELTLAQRKGGSSQSKRGEPSSHPPQPPSQPQPIRLGSSPFPPPLGPPHFLWPSLARAASTGKREKINENEKKNPPKKKLGKCLPPPSFRMRCLTIHSLHLHHGSPEAKEKTTHDRIADADKMSLLPPPGNAICSPSSLTPNNQPMPSPSSPSHSRHIGFTN